MGLARNFLDMNTRGDGAGARRAFLSPLHLGARLRLVGFALRHARAAPEIEAFAAERRVGRGRILTLGDPGCLTNSDTVRAYRFTGRLLAYLAGKAAAPQAWWRQLAGLLAVLGLSVLVVRGARPETIAISGLLLAGALLAAE